MRTFAVLAFFVFASPDPAQDTTPSGKIGGVWYESGQYQREWGFWFKVDFDLNNCYGRDCSILIWIYDKNGNPLKDVNGEYAAEDKTVLTRLDFTPGFQYTKYTKLGVFIPHNELHLGPGEHDLLFKIGLWWRDKSGWHKVHVSEFYKLGFKWGIAESGEITKLDIDYNNKLDNLNGIKLTINYTVHGMKGKKGRFAFAFYYDLAEFTLLHKHGKKEEGIMCYTQEFEPHLADTAFTGGWYRVPYSDFPLKVGKNWFYFKVWLEALSADNNWYVVDATSAAGFFVDNGSLKLDEVWVIDSLKVLLDWQATQEEAKLLEEIFTDFNKYLYDVTDGQVRVKSVSIALMDRHPADHYDGAFRIYKDFKKGDHGTINDNERYLLPQFRPWAYMGTPDKPGDSHIAYEALTTFGKDYLTRVLVHEFMHAAFSLPDEYQDQKDDASGKIYSQSLCSKDEVLRRAWNACIMSCSNPMYRELCKPDTHTKDASNKRLLPDDCYSIASAAVKKAFGKALVVPETPVEGPTNPPALQFRWK